MIDPGRMTVMIVDDNEANRYALNQLLRQAGYNIIEAATGKKTLQLVSNKIDLIILDVNLPDLNGFEVCAQIKGNVETRAIPVLQISASAISTHDKVKGLELGADGYIIMPVEPLEFLATVKSLLRMRVAEAGLRTTMADLRKAHDELEQRVMERTAELAAAHVREKHARKQAEESNRLKDEFLATISHELRTPLTAILGWAHLLKTQRLDNTQITDAIETIARNARTQSQLIEDLLDISRIITGKLRLETKSVALVPVIRAAVDSLRPTAETKSLRLNIVLDDSIGSLSGDPIRLQQVVYNLLSNAIKFTPPGGTIDIRLEQLGDQACITVSDTGQGISSDFLPYVFDRFRQADGSSTREHGGLGLGLSIVRHLVELHAGTVSVFSSGQGCGATFTVKLPLLSPANQETADRYSDRCANEALRLYGLKIVVVDDDVDTCEMMKTILEFAGAEVRFAHSANDALVTLQHWQADILVSDIGMPGGDGIWLIKKLRTLQLDKSIMAIAVSAYSRNDDRRRALAAGYHAYITKPIDPDEFIAIITSLVGLNWHCSAAYKLFNKSSD